MPLASPHFFTSVAIHSMSVASIPMRPFPLRVEEALVGRGDLGALHHVGVVSHHEVVHAVGKPQLVGRDRRRRAGPRGTACRTPPAASRARSSPSPGRWSRPRPRNCGGPRTSAIVRCTTLSDSARHSSTFTPYFFSNAVGERLGFRGRERGVEHQGAFLPRLLGEPRVAIGAAIAVDSSPFAGCANAAAAAGDETARRANGRRAWEGLRN